MSSLYLPPKGDKRSSTKRQALHIPLTLRPRTKVYENEGVNLNSQTRTNYVKFKKEFDAGDKELIENIKKQCELMLLNNR